MSATNFEVLRKITTKTLGFTKADLQKIVLADGFGNGSEKEIYRVMGVVSEIRPGQSDLGPYAKFIGEFLAVRTDNGAQFGSGVAIAPKAIEELLIGPVMEARKKNASLEMAFAISVKRDDASATSYVFTSRPLISLLASNRLAALAQMAGITPALAAPDPLAGEQQDTSGEMQSNVAEHPAAARRRSR